MGIDACCNKRISADSVMSFAPQNEREIQVQKYNSSNDALFQEIEIKYNFFTYLSLVEYINLLEFYSLETATVSIDKTKLKKDYSSKDTFLNYVMSVDEFQSFMENQLLKNDAIYEISGKNELLVDTTKSVMLEIYKSLELKLNQHYEEERNDRITKKSLIPFGILFCVSNVVGKVKLIFDLFKNDDETFTKSESLNEYLITSFLICSYCMISARRKITKTNKSLEELSKEQLIECLKVCELKDCQNLVNVFNDTFFNKDSFNWLEFKEKFENKENGFQWILSPRGIRKKLEENNV